MATSILVTKLFVPPTRAELVHRPGLIERLNGGLDRKLTLLSAPAGFGKTTLVSHWVEKLQDNKKTDVQPLKVAWLSLDEDDNDPVRFLTYFIAALIQNKEIDLGQGTLSMLQSPQPLSPNTVLTSLINDLADIPEKMVIVLDDYHLIEAEPIHQALVFLLENLPPQLHLVIATRQDPPLFMGRLRARDQITEIRAADLRFSESEAADFLNQVMGLNLSSEDITELETRTEGYIRDTLGNHD
jgi:LuxR family maltose regulon positive regulatory protein